MVLWYLSTSTFASSVRLPLTLPFQWRTVFVTTQHLGNHSEFDVRIAALDFFPDSDLRHLIHGSSNCPDSIENHPRLTAELANLLEPRPVTARRSSTPYGRINIVYLDYFGIFFFSRVLSIRFFLTRSRCHSSNNSLLPLIDY